MKTCNAGHESVSFTARHCPACALIEKFDKIILKLDDKIDHLRGKVTKLEAEVMKCYGKD